MSPTARAPGIATIEGLEPRQLLSAYLVDTASGADNGDYSAGDLSLREAVRLANETPGADEIRFAEALRDATIAVTGGQMTITDQLTITGLGIEHLTLDAANSGRIFVIDDGSDGSRIAVSITDLRLTRGSATNGGAIDNTEALTLRDVRLNLNSATGGGGAIHNSGELNLDRVVLALNTAGSSGGAIDNDGAETPTTLIATHLLQNSSVGEGGAIDHDGGPLTITTCTFTANTSARRGGAIANIGELTLDNVGFDENTTPGEGGAVYVGQIGRASMSGGHFEGNTAGTGGAIFNAGTSNLTDVEVYGNSATGNGGGIASAAGGRVDIQFSDLSGNSAGGDGGGLYSAFGGRLISSTVSTNRADGSGGGIEMTEVDGGFYAITVAFNTADADNDGVGSGGGIRIGNTSLIGRQELFLSIVAENKEGDGTPSDLAVRQGAEFVTTFGDVIGDPGSAASLVDGVDNNRVGQDPRLGSLGFHGGSTRVHTLLSGSAAVDTGLQAEFFTEDQHHRPRGYGASHDAGAWEYAPTAYSLDSLEADAVRGEATADGTHRFLIRNTEGELIVFGQRGDGWVGFNLQELTDAPIAIGGGTLWTDPSDGLTYVAAPSAEGLILYHLDEQGVWTYRDISTELGVSESASPSVSLLQMVTRDGGVILAGVTGSGRLSGFRQTGGTIEGEPAWEYLDISADLDAQGMSTPAFSGLAGYVTRWNAWNIVGIDADGDIQAVWVHPATFSRWRTDNLSDLTGAPPLSGQLSVTLTAWSAINLGGINEQGHVVVTWWVPAFKGSWVTSDLTNAAQGQTLAPGVVTGFVTPWGAINYAGLTASGEVAAYWWTPQNNRWLVTPLTSDAPAGSPRPVRDLSSTVATTGTMNVLGVGAGGEAVRVWWAPKLGGWRLDNLSELAVRT